LLENFLPLICKKIAKSIALEKDAMQKTGENVIIE
jgi:hypothetical protein